MNIGIGPLRLYTHDIGPRGHEYMRRLIFQTPLGTVRLHRILQPDADQDLHDHPWDFVTLILRGGYREEVPARGGGRETLIREPGAVVYHAAQDPHRIAELLDGPAWTLVLSGRRCREWGFFVDGSTRWVRWRDYVSQKGGSVAYRERRQKVNPAHREANNGR